MNSKRDVSGRPPPRGGSRARKPQDSGKPLQRLVAALFPPMLSRLLPDPIFVHDHDGRILMVTDSACASVQYSREALLSMNVVDLDQSFDLSAAQAAWSRMDSGVRHTLRGTHRRMDGSRFPVQIHLHVEEHRGQRIYFASVHDLSEQLRQEEHLRARALDLGNVFSSMAEGLVLQAKDGRIIEANPAAERILGLSRDELLGKTSIDPDWRCIREDGSPFPGEEHPGMVTLRTGRPISGALMGVYDRSPSLRWISINTQPVLGGSETIAVLATFTDVTAERRVSEELRVARSDLRGIIDAVPVGISSWDTQPVCRFANADFAARVGIPAEQLQGMPMDRVLGLERYQADLSHIRAALAGESCMKGYSEVRPDGSISYVQVYFIPTVTNGKVAGFTALGMDTTELATAANRGRELALRMDAVREEERRSLSVELHEGLAQDLFAIKLGLESLKAHAKGRAGVTEACADLGAALDKCLERTRQYANELRPTALKHLNAADAIQSCIRSFAENSPLIIRMSVAGAIPDLDEEGRWMLYRAAEEALTNVALHANATTVAISLESDAQWVQMTVVDDGVGISEPALSKNGALGLFGLGERLAVIGGSLTIRGSESGTHMSVKIPISGRSPSPSR